MHHRLTSLNKLINYLASWALGLALNKILYELSLLL